MLTNINDGFSMPATHSLHPSILRAYDIRGVADETLFEQDALHIGKAYATAVIRATGLAQPNIALAWDGRLSTPKLRAQLVEGILSTGATVWGFWHRPHPHALFRRISYQSRRRA